MTEEFAARRAKARARLDSIDPAMTGGAGDPLRRDWFRAVYDLAGDDPACVPWADLAPHPLLADWLQFSLPGSQQSAPTPNPSAQGEGERRLSGLRALDVGCGLGDNAEALAVAGADVTAFDLSEKAVEWAKRRFPASAVDYVCADLFAPPAAWRGAFAFVHECYTLQALTPDVRARAFAALASFLAPDGRLLVIARARRDGDPAAGPPWPLSRGELDAFAAEGGLSLETVENIAPPGERPHWRALYRRAA